MTIEPTALDEQSSSQSSVPLSVTLKRGIWLMRLTYAVLAINAILDLISLRSGGISISVLISASIQIAAVALLVFAEFLVRRGRTLPAALLAIIVPVIGLTAMGLFNPINIGWLVGLVASLLLSLVAIHLMPVQSIGLGIFLSFTGGSIIALTDYVSRSVKYSLNYSDAATILILLLTVGLAVLLFIRFTTYPVTAKFVLAIATVTSVILNLLGVVISTVVGSQPGITQGILQMIHITYLVGSQVGIVLSSLAAFLLARLITGPLTEVVELARRVSEDGDLSHQARVFYPDEVGRTAEAINAMIEMLDGLAREAARMAEGDLTVQFHPRSAEDVLGWAFEHMAQSLRALVGQITENSEQVNHASRDLADAAQNAGHAAAQINLTMDQVARGAAEQASVAAQTTESVDAMRRTIEGVKEGVHYQSEAVDQAASVTSLIVNAIQQVSLEARDGVARAGETVREADLGSATIQETIAGMAALQENVQASGRKVQEMKDRSDEIGSILEAIEEIASQINLLALNAAIEAARAGEAGKGFAVVADEVRKLAEKSTNATKEIGDLIHNIHASTDEAVSAMNAGLDVVKVGMTRANSAGLALDTILKSVRDMEAQVGRIAQSAGQVDSSVESLMQAMDQVGRIVAENTDAASEMSERSGEVLHAVENITSISEENSASAEEVSASVGEMSAQVATVTESASMLMDMAGALSDQVKQFRL